MTVEHDYLDLLMEAAERGERHDDRTGVGTASLFARQLRHDWADGFPLLTTKSVPLSKVATELLWMLEGRTDTKWLNGRGCRIWDQWATEEKCAGRGREAGQLGPTYGAMLREYPVGDAKLLGDDGYHWEMAGKHHVDQVAQLLDTLKVSPGSRRHAVTLWHPYWATHVEVPPCLVGFEAKCHDPPYSSSRQLSLHATFRSSDLFIGLPFDLAAMALLQALLCQETGRGPRELVLTLVDAHLYNNHRDAADRQLMRQPERLPTLVVERYRNITDWHVRAEGYDPQPAIPAPVAV